VKIRDHGGLIDTREKVMRVVGFAAAFRRSELVPRDAWISSRKR
jgi:hypothetical protein